MRQSSSNRKQRRARSKKQKSVFDFLMGKSRTGNRPGELSDDALAALCSDVTFITYRATHGGVIVGRELIAQWKGLQALPNPKEVFRELLARLGIEKDDAALYMSLAANFDASGDGNREYSAAEFVAGDPRSWSAEGKHELLRHLRDSLFGERGDK